MKSFKVLLIYRDLLQQSIKDQLILKKIICVFARARSKRCRKYKAVQKLLKLKKEKENDAI
jgi:hypothetical protein